MIRTYACTAALLLMLAADALSQPRTDFSGSWILDPAFSVGLKRAERKGLTLIVRQTDRDILFEQSTPGSPTRVMTYRLDGTETASKTGRAEIKTRSRWDGERLVTEGRQRVRLLFVQFSDRFSETRWLTNGGDTLVVESTVYHHHPRFRKLVFQRSK